MNASSDIKVAEQCLQDIPLNWDGRETVLLLKRVDYNWRQMEWWGFYFEWLCRDRLQREFEIPGERIGRTTFDAKRTINWDFKAKAIKSDDHRCILNDKDAMDASIERHGGHGAIIGLFDVEYNDTDRSFQKWHTELKGGASSYELERAQRTAVSRYRKTRVQLVEIIFVVFDAQLVARLGIHHQGRNSNGRPRPPKYMYDFDDGCIAERMTMGKE